MSELFDREASKESNEHEVSDDTMIVLKCVNSVRRKLITLSNLLLQWLKILNDDALWAGFDEARRGRTGFSFISLDPT